VQIPPMLVRMLREHIDRYGVGVDGRIFRGARGGDFPDTEYGKVWRMARQRASTPEQQSSPLARRPYDLRHAAASLWLNPGVPATDVARRPGHGVAVLLRVYANCLDGQQDTMNDRIDEALGE
jgi:integrase